MKYSLLFLLLVTSTGVLAQTDKTQLIQEIAHYQDSLENIMRIPEESPLSYTDFANFDSLDFYPINLDYYIVAKFVRTPNQEPFEMATTRARVQQPIYEKYGEIYFELEGQEIMLPVYQSHDLREMEEWKNYLFLPFRDPTNKTETYGGGRYLELWNTGANSIVVDFNRAYNPYCVYNTKYSCPIVPRENNLTVPVYAGEKRYKNPVGK